MIEILYYYLLPEDTSSEDSRAVPSPTLFAPAGDFVPQTPVKPRRTLPPSGTRDTADKREMLRRVMPNVDALEERFRAMGLT